MTRGTVLVVDDDPDIVAILDEALSDEGYAVLTARVPALSGVAHDVHPDVILLDILMPEMDGVEISRRLHADPTTADIPIVVMSAHAKQTRCCHRWARKAGSANPSILTRRWPPWTAGCRRSASPARRYRVGRRHHPAPSRCNTMSNGTPCG